MNLKGFFAFFACFLALASLGEAASISAPIESGLNFRSVVILGETIPTSSYLEKTFYNIGGYGSLDFKVSAQSAGSAITTANVSWVLPSAGSTVELTSETLTAATDITDFDSKDCIIRIYSNHGAPVVITGNILFRGVH